MEDDETRLWIFNLSGRTPVAARPFPVGVFSSHEVVVPWIQAGTHSGTLTLYPLDVGVYDWCIAKGTFRPKRPEQRIPRFVQNFSSASQEHIHFDEGQYRPANDPLCFTRPSAEWVWVFCGGHNPFPSGVFTTLELARAWITRGGLSGTLSGFPVDRFVQDWCQETGRMSRTCEASPDCRWGQHSEGACPPHWHFVEGQGVGHLPHEE